MSSTENEDSLPPPPPVIPSDVMPDKEKPDKEKTDEDKPDQEKPDKEKPEMKKVLRIPIARRGLASVGSTLQLYTNHFRVNVGNTDGYFFQYSVSLFYEDGRPVDGKGVGRKVLDKVQETYDSELDGKNFAYDGEKTLFTLGSLPRNLFEFTVVLEDVVSTSRNYGNVSPGGTGESSESDKKRMRRPNRAKTFKVEISFASKIPLQAIANALRGQYSDNYQEAIRVLDIILRQHAAKQGCLLVRQSFFYNDPNKFTDVGGGVLGCNGFHSSFRTTQSGLSLNIDVSTTMIVTPGPVVDFLISNQNAKDPFTLDWGKAKRTLKNLRIKASPSNQEYKITGLSDLPCKEQIFTLKKKGDDATVEVTVYDYFVNHRKIDLRYSGDLPCINVGKPKRPTYIPLELCSLVSLQRYTKALSTLQRSSLVEKSRQKPLKRIEALKDALSRSNYGSEPMLRNCGISINSGFTVVEGRVLQAPRLKFGNGEDNPRNGRWNFNQKTLVNPTTIEGWAVVNFSARCELRGLVNNLLKCAEMKGISMEPPVGVFEEDFRNKRAPPLVRVGKMLDMLKPNFPKPPKFILCLLPERKNSDLYGPWKKISLVNFGMVTQCIAPPQRVNDQYLTNVLLKINAKLGGLNSMLSVEYSPSIPVVSKSPTLIIGMDVSHGPPGQTDIPSIAAVVSSREWPLISKYRAFVRTQSPKLEMIDNLFNRVSDEKDNGIIRALLCDFFQSSGSRKPENIIIFRDGVSESQFNQVLNIELDQIIEACKFLDDKWSPKFLVIVAQKNHHTRFFHTDPRNDNNVPPGTVIDNKICHPRNYDFYMCAHNGAIGTSRPTHYHVLLDEIGFSPNDLQQLVHALSYVYQRSTTAISVVAPICYAHLAASQMAQLVKFEERSETASSHDGAADRPVPQLPVLHKDVCESMFFC